MSDCLPNDENRCEVVLPDPAGSGCKPSEPTVASVVESVVCADGAPAIMRTVTMSDGSSVSTFIGADGASLEPTSWTPGSCLDTINC